MVILVSQWSGWKRNANTSVPSLPSLPPSESCRTDLFRRITQQRTSRLFRLSRNVRSQIPLFHRRLPPSVSSCELTTSLPSFDTRPRKFWTALNLPFQPKKSQRDADHYVTPPAMLSESGSQALMSRKGGNGLSSPLRSFSCASCQVEWMAIAKASRDNRIKTVQAKNAGKKAEVRFVSSLSLVLSFSISFASLLSFQLSSSLLNTDRHSSLPFSSDEPNRTSQPPS